MPFRLWRKVRKPPVFELVAFHIPYLMMDFRLQTYGLQPKIHGFSHGLKSVHWTLFAPVCALVPPFRIPSHPLPITKATLLGGLCYWQRMRDSNPRERSQSPVCYRYTNPLSAERLYYTHFRQKVKEYFQPFRRARRNSPRARPMAAGTTQPRLMLKKGRIF